MAIGTDALIDFFGTQATITTTGSSTTDGSYTSAGSWTNADDAPYIGAVLVAQWSTATDIGGRTVSLYTRMMNIQITNDAAAPSDDNQAVFLGTFVVPSDTASTNLYMPLSQGVVPIPNYYTSQVHDLYIKNDSGQTISANWALYVTPIAPGPHG